MRHYQQWAFSLPELLVALTLLIILLSIAIPQATQLIEKNRLQAASDLLLRNLQTARARAVTEERTLLICPSSGITCMEDWNEGWILKSPTSDEILNRDRIPELDGVLRWAGFRKEILFRSDGTSPTGNGRFFLCTPRGLAWQLVINRQGRIRRSEPKEDLKDARRCN
ncbi:MULTISPECIES: GspH/FimT family pseudopilin [Pseudomonas]|uniref:GspH/FimT family protein n=1 Tax=Pseudomonadaceae TaxID=135621 RepID=UPI001581E435|nr:GspH/FimT family pseudopilin [Pseudomonas sp. BMW13]